ncbi:MAG: hypothetical protein KAQ83_00955, partial [Nanoarchaeota archaeon]|nr:hypothetical protein [Nanoarchaeota archaeon]
MLLLVLISSTTISASFFLPNVTSNSVIKATPFNSDNSISFPNPSSNEGISSHNNPWNIFIPMLSEKNIEIALSKPLYEIIKEERRPIIFNEPVIWDAILKINNDGKSSNSTKTLTYQTPKINLYVKTSKNNNSDPKNNPWTQNISLTTDYNEVYENINLEIATPKANKINITPSFDYDRISENNINIYIPEIFKTEEIVVKGEFITELNFSLNLTLNATFNLTINQTFNQSINWTLNGSGDSIYFETFVKNIYFETEENWPITLKIDKKFESEILDIKKEEETLNNFLLDYNVIDKDLNLRNSEIDNFLETRGDLFSIINLRNTLSSVNLKNIISLAGGDGTDLIIQKQKQIIEKRKLIEDSHSEGFKAEIKFKDFPVKSIEFEDIVIKNSTIDLGIEEVDLKDEGYIQSYAIDPEKLDFTLAKVTATAKGRYLMKCESWNFENQTCVIERNCTGELDGRKNPICEVSGGWKKIRKLIPGEEYSFNLTPKDPCFAEYNATFTAPYCANGSSPCVAGSTLLKSRGTLATPEPNQPNTIDSCSDGGSGTYSSDESLENITITSLNNSQFRPGDTVRVEAYAYCWNTGSNDNINFVYANNASAASPSWTVKNYTDPCPGAGFQQVSTNLKLDNVEGDHVIRVVMEYDGAVTDTCGPDGYDDTDDVVFKVENKPLAPDIYVQRGIATVADTTSSVNVTLDLTMNFSKTLILFTANTNDATPDDWQYTPNMSLDGNTITFERYDNNSASEIKWEAIQADYLTVQRGQEALLSGTASVNISISEVDLSESFVIVYGRCADETDSDSNAGFFAGNFTNSTILHLWRGNQGDCAATVSWQVVEFDSSFVESGISTIANSAENTTASLSRTLSNVSQSMLFFSSASIGTDTGMDSNMIMGNISANNELFFTHEPGTTYANSQRDIAWFVIEVPGMKVQRSFTALAADTSESLNSIVMNRSFYWGSGWGSGGGQTYSNALYNAEINETDNLFLDKQTGSQTQNIIWQVMELPLEIQTTYNCTYTKFSGDTTDFNKEPSPVVSSGTLEIPSYGKIIWNNPINITNQNFDLNVNITSNNIWLNTDGLKSEINSSANLSLYNINWQYPIIFRDNNYCTDCTWISYGSGILAFSVNYFDIFTSRENANLSIWDTTNFQLKAINEQIYFYANYSNTTNNQPLNGTNIDCEFSQNSSGSWSSPLSMIFNVSSGLYEYNMSFAVNDTYEF